MKVNPIWFGLMCGTAAAVGLGGCAHGPAGVASASQLPASALAKARKHTAAALAALERSDTATAILEAESATRLDPQSVDTRLVLGRAYFEAGRFHSASIVFSDCLTLAPDNGRAALNLALTQLAQGNEGDAMATLDRYLSLLSSADRGLALAIGGNPQQGVAILEAAIRGGHADGKIRQNLGLAYALQGRWPNAEVMAVQDLSPLEAETRVGEWHQLAGMQGSALKMQQLLGVRPVAEDVFPEEFALNATVPAGSGTQMASAETIYAQLPAGVQSSASDPVPAATPDASYAPSAAVDMAALQGPAAVDIAPSAYVSDDGRSRTVASEVLPGVQPAAQPAAVAAPLALAEATGVKPNREMIRVSAQLAGEIMPYGGFHDGAASAPPLQRVATARPSTPMRIAAAKAAMPRAVTGKYVAQLGAYSSNERAASAWMTISGRLGNVSARPVTAVLARGNVTFHRLSAGGFATRAEASNFCAKAARAGQACFVRTASADVPIQSAEARGVNMASR